MDCKHFEEGGKKTLVYITIIVILILIDIIVLIFSLGIKKNESKIETSVTTEEQVTTLAIKENNEIASKDPINKKLEWNLTLVNAENRLPDDYSMELADIDKYRKFDSRAINYLKNMLSAMKNNGITNSWIQSSYRSVEYQTRLYEEKTNEYMSMGYSKEEAQAHTEETINKPGHSEHNLGLAVDFNYVNNDFENTKAYKWLKENAKNYGFVLRYPKDKEQITKVKYEPWHWRYVGVEHAIKMDELNMSLEEYIEYLNNKEDISVKDN